ncbi:YcfL protein [Flavobacterium phage vB_FspM_immuto_3-5A]|uniref:YcfL protein n=1 Tax=Flavobacterium phage vB_FspM_immuto_2-6A TaxID=2801477 RepID=A0A7T8ERS9_9CAUD|nr:YcfL protein [Flavobacterium phage vB_FspM_immuto_2-6A]QQO91709.1 YcfL protein [Flavobacterium phage vB_FspM_immuto_2-6A]QQO91948.1 YcfL protein [Flavobacterium phage vB_FspM_immuto_3-5A]QQO92186.1 YcfL protein [Flavobacterium phage vB_FspM_immuto_13-6C]
MKKVFLTLALVAAVLVSCKQVSTEETSTVDSTAVISTEEAAIIETEKVQDSIDAATDSTVVSDDEARDYLKDAIK